MKKILAVDDESTNLLIIKELLEDEYEIVCLESPLEVEPKLQDFFPDLILLDVNMPEKDGYEVCSWLKEEFEYQDIPVVFVSAKDSVEERLAGYDVGGFDYIVKPFEYSEFLHKIEKISQRIDEMNSIKKDYQSAFDTAMQAMSGAGELGVVMQFLDNIIACEEYSEVVNKMFETLNSFGLNCSLQIRVSDDTLNFSSEGSINPLEAELLTKVKNKGRFVDSGCRTFVNFDRISILIKNMPVDDQVIYGRIKDNIPPMLNGAEARIKAIEDELLLKEKKQILKKSIDKTHTALNLAKEKLNELKLQNTTLMENLIREIDTELLSLELTEQKEAYLLKILESNKKKVSSSYEDGMKLEDIFQKIIDRLSYAID